MSEGGGMSDFWKDKNVVVTGGSGFLGSHVADELSARGYEVIVYESGGKRKKPDT